MQKAKMKFLFCLLTTIYLITAPFAEAQQAKKVPRIGYYSGEGGPSTPTPNIEAFRQGLRDLAYIEGK